MKCLINNKYLYIFFISVLSLFLSCYGMAESIPKGQGDGAYILTVGSEKGSLFLVASPQAASGMRSLLKKAESGDPVSQYWLGYMYFYGDRVVRDYSDAAYWFARAAASNNSDAQFMVGYMYARGEGVKKNNNKAIFWYKEATRQGHAGAMFRLGEMYLFGDGIERDIQKGKRLLSESAKKGNNGAVRLLKEFKQ